MGFWIFMLFMNLLIPLTMIGLGTDFIKGGPKDINLFYGYRTSMSMKNMETWQFAHIYFGRLWRKTGILLLPIILAAMLFVFGKNNDTVGTFGGFLCFFSIIILILPILPTELALRKRFDADGQRRL